jgi:hypothetical protein
MAIVRAISCGLILCSWLPKGFAKNSLQYPNLTAKGHVVLYVDMSFVECNKAECDAM